MKGTEGIDYVITECGHCKGNGKCNCYDCLEASAVRTVLNEDGTYYPHIRDAHIKCLKENDDSVFCTICKGVGKVVFWRE